MQLGMDDELEIDGAIVDRRRMSNSPIFKFTELDNTLKYVAPSNGEFDPVEL